MRRSRRNFIKVSAVVGAGALMPRDWWMMRAMAQAQAPAQVPLAGKSIPQFVDPLPDLWFNNPSDAVSGIFTTASTNVDIFMQEFQSKLLPAGFVPANGIPYAGTWVWGYRVPGVPYTADCSYLGPIILANRGTATRMNFVNNLGLASATNVLAYRNSVDQTLDWADPLNYSANACNAASDAPATGNCLLNYSGPIPACVHLHGGEVPPQLDGGPDAWFTSDGLYKGHAYWTWTGASAPVPSGSNFAIYNYPNTQEASPIWFHDHTLGATRLNVFAGLAGGYLVADPALILPTGLTAYGIGTDPIVPLIIQDRMFDTNGELFFPAGVPFITNPEHPFWVPEFVGDTICVNGKVWPYKPVDRKRYRFLFLNGSNARTYDLSLIDKVTGIRGPRMWVIGTDGGYLDTPKLIDPNSVNKAVPKSLVIMPGERYDVIIDFADTDWQARLAAAGLANQPINLILQNSAKTPYPGGAPASQSTTGRVMQFNVSNQAVPPDAGFNPAAVGAVIRPPAATAWANAPKPIERLVNPATGTNAVPFHKRRQLTLNEVMGPGGPLEVLVNNTKLSGMSVATDVFVDPVYGPGARPDFTAVVDPIPGAAQAGAPKTSVTTFYSELPQEGETELWEVVNMTADAHPIHLHLVQFQVMNRQPFDVKGYNAAYNALFPGTNAVNDPMTGLPYPPGVFIGGFGPPLNYNTGQPFNAPPGTPATGILGGNPDVAPFLVKKSVPAPPLSYEQGWKDTVVMMPGEVTRIMVRWAPTDIPAATPAADISFPFDPDGGHGYVFHCHIIDHEDNEMMRPDQVQINTSFPADLRPLQKGTHY